MNDYWQYNVENYPLKSLNSARSCVDSKLKILGLSNTPWADVACEYEPLLRIALFSSATNLGEYRQPDTTARIFHQKKRVLKESIYSPIFARIKPIMFANESNIKDLALLKNEDWPVKKEEHIYMINENICGKENKRRALICI